MRQHSRCVPFNAELAIAQVKDYAIFVSDEEGRAASWNEGVERVLGWKEDEWLGQPAHVIFPPGDAEDAARELEHARKNARADDDRWLVRKDGTRFFARGVTTAISRDGKHCGFLKVLRDQTEVHQQEISLRESQAQLEKAKKALQTADRRKDEFLATLAHELRNPLAPIRAGLQILSLTRNDPEKVEQSRQMMERQVGYLIHLVDDLLDISRITHGKLELRSGPLALAVVLEGALEIARGMIEAEGHALSTDLPDRSVRVEGDLTRLTQIFANLLINAAKYTPRGGKIELRGTVENDLAVVSVRDNGIGLTPEAITEVFQMFSQVRRLHHAPLGLGIGLALARALVEMHHGTIEARSPGPNLGSTFTVRLPLVGSRSRPAAQDEERARERESATRRVLVADDNADSAESLAILLRMSGHEVRTARDGLEAVEIADQFHPEIALLDIGMPRMDGLEAARQLRLASWASNLTLIAMTGWGQDVDRARSRQAGFTQHLVKPVDPLELDRLVGGLPLPASPLH